MDDYLKYDTKLGKLCRSHVKSLMQENTEYPMLNELSKDIHEEELKLSITKFYSVKKTNSYFKDTNYNYLSPMPSNTMNLQFPSVAKKLFK